jgi:hypothetical protein
MQLKSLREFGIHCLIIGGGLCLLSLNLCTAQAQNAEPPFVDTVGTPAIHNDTKLENQLLDLLFYDVMLRSPSPEEASWLRSFYGGISQKDIAYTGLVRFLLSHPEARLPTQEQWRNDTLGVYRTLCWRFFTSVPSEAELLVASRFFREHGLPPVRKFVYEVLTSERYLMP